MQQIWAQVERRLEELGCLEAMELRAGASEAEIRCLEKHLAVTLPDALRDFLARHDGQNGFGLMYGEQFLSVDGIRNQWDTWRSLDEADMNADSAEWMKSAPEGAVQPMYCNTRWIPLTHDAGGNHIGLDFDPGVSGTSGQVIVFGRDEDTKRLLAPSFTEFLSEWAAMLEKATWDGEALETPWPAARSGH
ncbi:KNR4-like cell wall assembly/cell proliferation coordinating protein [Xylophilus rhododendri]|uniref:KNR4-like cell wall assembly/cell proliferation coordinating protein n=1 Tax=Xylophilus rhododendri TaxID=2697032 RepID=A0A857JED5_9BURK|nr:SMI1/KNR4 family protein [Xylophilus rhododendri]QHJ01046.1 KNR4-like cell wall assembly/cell proliferation coordinating protein [Xylophilus rhododendri]